MMGIDGLVCFRFFTPFYACFMGFLVGFALFKLQHYKNFVANLLLTFA
jgi:hypothetical protein